MVVNNPNNWHWVDKNCLGWSRDYFNDKLTGLKQTNGDDSAEITAVLLVEGDVDVSQRKGKVISLFNLRLVLNFAASDAHNSGKGSITVPELAYDTEEDELQFEVLLHDETAENDHLRLVVKKLLVPELRKLLLRFGPDLIETNASDIQLEADKVQSQYTKANQAGSKPASSSSSASTTTTKSTPAPAHKPKVVNTLTLHLEPVFNTTAEQIYITLTDAQRVAAWLRLAPQLAQPVTENSPFALFGGSVTGQFTKLNPFDHIAQQWRLLDWKQGHHAVLDMQLIQGTLDTKVVVKFSGIPVGEEERVRNNFEEYYVRAIKITFGFGAVL